MMQEKQLRCKISSLEQLVEVWLGHFLDSVNHSHILGCGADVGNSCK